jgi:uncharacterized protein (TIGR02597 family)
MKRKISFTLLAAAAACGFSLAEPVYTDPVGYLTIPIPGTNNETTSKLQLASQGLLPSDAIQATGTATDVTTTYLEDTTAAWTPGAYVGFFIEITSGPLEGTFTLITASSETQLTTEDDISAAGTTPTYRIIKSFTVGSLVGNPPEASVLGGGSTLGAADNLLILDATTGVYDTIWYKNGGIGGTGWRASSLGTADAANLIVHPNAGLVFQRKQATDGSLVISGSVKTSQTDVWVEGNGSGTVLNILSIQFPVDQLTLQDSGLYTGDPSTGLLGGTTLGAADNVLIYDASTGVYDTIWYKNGGIGGTGWRASSTGTADAGANLIPSGRAILVQRKSGDTFIWNVPSLNVAQ